MHILRTRTKKTIAFFQAYMDVLMTLRWRKFCIIYENNDGLVRVQELLKNQTWQITLKQLPVKDDYRWAADLLTCWDWYYRGYRNLHAVTVFCFCLSIKFVLRISNILRDVLRWRKSTAPGNAMLFSPATYGQTTLEVFQEGFVSFLSES